MMQSKRAMESAAVIVLLFATAAAGQTEPNRYNTGDFKVGDRVSADPMVIKQWQPCTVTGTRPLPSNPAKLDSVAIRCDNGLTYSAIATTDQVRKLQGGPAAPSWNVTQASKVGPKGETPYGTRRPHTCGPLKGPISPALARQAFICGAEHESGEYLYLVENIQLEVGGPVRYNPNTQTGFEAMDTRVPIYPIRGSFAEYQCHRQVADPSERFYNYDRNCNRFDNRHATGYCWKSTFGDWRCTMNDLSKIDADKHFNVAPPR